MNAKFTLRPFARNTRKWMAAGAVAAAVAGMSVDGSAQTFATRIGNCTINDAVHEHIKLWKEELEKRSNGRIKANLFINCQLGTIGNQIEGVQLGTQDFFAAPPGFAVGIDPRYQVSDAPGLFDNLAHAHRGIRHPVFYDKFMQLGREKGLTPVSLWAAGGANYITLRPVRQLKDFNGKKLRVLASKMETELMSRLGATGVPVTFTEIVPALTTKTIDGARTATLVMASAKMYTAAKYVTHIDDSFITLMTWVSNQYLTKLPSDLRDLVFQVGRDLEPRMLPIAQSDFDRAVKELKDNGVEIIRLPPDEQKAWLLKARLVSDEFLGSNPATKDLYPFLKEAADKTRGG